MTSVQATDSTIHRPSAITNPLKRFPWLPNWLSYITYLTLAATIAGRLGQYFFLFELCSHFATQLAVVDCLLAIYWLTQRSWTLTFIAAACMSWHSFLVLPWLTADKPTPVNPADIRILHANVLYTRDEVESTIQMIREQKPDIFVLQEMTPESIDHVSAAFQNEYPYRDTVLAKDPCFLLVASRTPILVDQQAKRSHRVIHLLTTIKNQDVSFITVHPRTPIWPDWFAERNEQLRFVAEKARTVPHAAVLIGDFNVSVFSPVYASIFEKPGGLFASRRGFGLQPTWPRFMPPAMMPIDHAFTNAGFQTVGFKTLAQPGSDHKAVVVDLAYKR